MTPPKGKRLTRTEYDRLIGSLRLCPSISREQLAPLIWHCNAMWDAVAEAEKRLNDFQNPSFFDMSMTYRRIHEWLLDPQHYRVQIQGYSKYNKTTISEMYEMANRWARENGRRILHDPMAVKNNDSIAGDDHEETRGDSSHRPKGNGESTE